MKTLLCVGAALFAIWRPVYAQSDLSGLWRAEGLDPAVWRVALRADGRALTGTVMSCTSLPVEIYDGRVDGNTITFKCNSPDGDRTVSFTGIVNGDEISFAWEKRVRPGGVSRPDPVDVQFEDPDARNLFGASTPARFIARRVRSEGRDIAAAVNLPDKDVKVEGTLFIPQNVKRVRAVIVLFNSGIAWNGMGGAFYSDPELRRLAAALECALLLPRFTEMQWGTGIGVLANAALGSGEALIRLLDRLAPESGHSEIANAPLLLWAHSRTGQLSTTFAALHPHRIVGIVSYHAGAVMAGQYKNVLKDIPALILVDRVGLERQAKLNADREGWRSGEALWRSGRVIGAPWTFGIEPNAVHQNPDDLKPANALVIPWMAAVLRQRLSPDARGLNLISESSGWLGNIRTHEVAPSATFAGPKEEATWLPDEQSARGWQVLVGAAK
jgi:hypothetical protein